MSLLIIVSLKRSNENLTAAISTYLVKNDFFSHHLQLCKGRMAGSVECINGSL
jgi:hypothetical protein